MSTPSQRILVPSVSDLAVSIPNDAKYDESKQRRERGHSLIPDYSTYRRLHKKSLESPYEFWDDILKKFTWKKLPSKEKFFNANFDLRKGDPFIRWMSDGSTNICYNCIDRHLEHGLANRVAFDWLGNEPGQRLTYTYKQLHEEVCRLSNALVSAGVKPNDNVGVYMAMSPEAVISMLAISRIGAVHVVVFGGFSSDALSKRLNDTQAKVLLAIDGCYRGSKPIKIEQIAREAIELCRKRGHQVEKLILKSHSKRFAKSTAGNTDAQNSCNSKPVFGCTVLDYDEFVRGFGSSHEPVWRMGDDLLFILHTSGSTGPPKGIMHANAGYMVYAAATFRYTFDFNVNSNDVFFCTGDVGWITGHTYNCYGPLLMGAHFIVFEGIPLYPDAGRLWQICEQYSVTHFYTAPTAIRALISHGDDFVLKYDLSKLRVLGTVGEPINTSAWHWFNDVVGRGHCTIVDTYFQTETGGHVITNLPRVFPCKPGSASLPFFGVEFAILDDEGRELKGECEGNLVMKQCGPGMMKGVYNRMQDFGKIYFSKFPGYYFTGDGATRDKDGYYWITGRVDDMMNCSGHLLSSAEIEGLIASHPAVSECSVVGVPHPLKAETPYAFVVLKRNVDLSISSTDGLSNAHHVTHRNEEQSTQLKNELRNLVRTHIGPFATPEKVIICSALPKTRSGKVLRRVMRTITAGKTTFGDLSAITDQSVIDELIGKVAVSHADNPSEKIRSSTNQS